jgi:hypothetical protein
MANFCVNGPAYAAAEKVRFEALSTAALIKQGVAVAQFALNAADAISNFRKLRNVTSRGIAIEEEQHTHLKNTYWPAETQMLNEFTQKTPWESQAVLAKRYAGRMWAPLAVGFAREIHLMECNKPRYCTNSHIKRIQELMVQRSAVRANVTLLADRIAFYEIQAVEDTDIERRKQSIAMRQGLVQQAASLMQTAAKGFSGAGASALGAVNNAISAFGHAWGQRNNADNRVGSDPYFHSQVSRNAGGVAQSDPTQGYNYSLQLPDLPTNMSSSPEYSAFVSAPEESKPVDSPSLPDSGVYPNLPGGSEFA